MASSENCEWRGLWLDRTGCTSVLVGHPKRTHALTARTVPVGSMPAFLQMSFLGGARLVASRDERRLARGYPRRAPSRSDSSLQRTFAGPKNEVIGHYLIALSQSLSYEAPIRRIVDEEFGTPRRPSRARPVPTATRASIRSLPETSSSVQPCPDACGRGKVILCSARSQGSTAALRRPGRAEADALRHHLP